MLLKQLPVKKRQRQETEQCILELEEHPTKRRSTTATHQIPPSLSLSNASDQSCSTKNLQDSSSCTVNLKLRSSEKDLSSSQSRLFLLSQLSPSSTTALPCSSPLSSCLIKGEEKTRYCSSQVLGNPNIPSDTEMLESFLDSPGPVCHDISPNITVRMPKQIRHSLTSLNLDDEVALNFVENVTKVDVHERSSRVSKPDSKRDISPSVTVTGLSDIQMDVEDLQLSNNNFEPPTRNDYINSRDTLKLQGKDNCGSSNFWDVKRSFSMGYRANCEKCRLKVPGHFSHIITS